jgi:hypothetical protein
MEGEIIVVLNEFRFKWRSFGWLTRKKIVEMLDPKMENGDQIFYKNHEILRGCRNNNWLAWKMVSMETDEWLAIKITHECF